MASSMRAGAFANIPDYKGGFAFTIADKPVEVVQSFRWEGVPWTASQFRCGWRGAAWQLCWYFLRRRCSIDSIRRAGLDEREEKWHTASAGGAFANEAAFENGAAASATALAVPAGDSARPAAARIAAGRLTALEAGDRSNAFVRLFVAELKLAVKGLHWWWYTVAAGLLIAQATAPLATASSAFAGTSWLWLVLVWSGMGARESRFGTRALLFSSARILPRQLFACWLAGFFTRCRVRLCCGTAHSCDARCWCAAAVDCRSCAASFNGVGARRVERNVEAV